MPTMLSVQLPAASSAAGPADARPLLAAPHRPTPPDACPTPPAASTNLRAAAQSNQPGEVFQYKPSPERHTAGSSASGTHDSMPDAAIRSSPASESQLTCAGESVTGVSPAVRPSAS